MINIKELELSILADNMLKRAGISSVKQLYNLTRKDLMKIPGVGVITVNEIEDELVNARGATRKISRCNFRIAEAKTVLAEHKKYVKSLKKDLHEALEISQLAIDRLRDK